jgi:hypothetical protein
VCLSYCGKPSSLYHVFVTTDHNLYGSNEVPSYTAAGLMWSALDLFIGAEEIREDPTDMEIDADIIDRFEDRAIELLSLLSF